jgi:hypothetical protein
MASGDVWSQSAISDPTLDSFGKTDCVERLSAHRHKHRHTHTHTHARARARTHKHKHTHTQGGTRNGHQISVGRLRLSN